MGWIYFGLSILFWTATIFSMYVACSGYGWFRFIEVACFLSTLAFAALSVEYFDM